MVREQMDRFMAEVAPAFEGTHLDITRGAVVAAAP